MTNADFSYYSDGGMNCKVYIPDNVNSNTEVFVFVHGGSEMTDANRNNDWNSLINYQLEKHGSDSIVVMPTMNDRWNENWANNTMNIVENIQSEYCITNDNVVSCGFSFGGWGAINTTIENIKRNPNVEPQIVYMLDDYGHSSWLDKNVFVNGGKEALLENNSIVFSYVNPGAAASNEITDKTTQMQTFAESGINYVRVVCNKGFQHSAIKDNFFLNGMVDYTNGKVKLPEDGYTYQRSIVSVDPNTGKKVVSWENIDVNDINTKDKLFSYFNLDGSGIIDNTIDSPLLSGLGSSMIGRDTFVDLVSLQDWSRKIESINNEMLEQLSMMLSKIESISDKWNSNFASTFIDDSSNLIESVQRTHSDMYNISKGLIDVVNVEDNF